MPAGAPERDEKGRFLNSPGPGRGKSELTRLRDRFIECMLSDFGEHGLEAIQQFRQEDPGGYVRSVISMFPKGVQLDVTEFQTISLDFSGFDEDDQANWIDGEAITDCTRIQAYPSGQIETTDTDLAVDPGGNTHSLLERLAPVTDNESVYEACNNYPSGSGDAHSDAPSRRVSAYVDLSDV